MWDSQLPGSGNVVSKQNRLQSRQLRPWRDHVLDAFRHVSLTGANNEPFFFPLRLGFLPFDSEFTEEVIRNTIEGRYDLEDEFWQCVSDEAKDLVQKLLEKDPERRISLVNAVEHPWFKVFQPIQSNREDRVKSHFSWVNNNSKLRLKLERISI